VRFAVLNLYYNAAVAMADGAGAAALLEEGILCAGRFLASRESSDLIRKQILVLFGITAKRAPPHRSVELIEVAFGYAREWIDAGDIDTELQREVLRVINVASYVDTPPVYERTALLIDEGLRYARQWIVAGQLHAQAREEVLDLFINAGFFYSAEVSYL
jgi:hypothetical protein